MVSPRLMNEVPLKSYALPLILLSFFSVAALRAQSLKGSIVGAIADGSGRPVAGASVTLISTDTTRRRTATSDSRGEFVISLLAPGAYRLEAEREGFRKHVQSIELLVDQEIRLDIPLVPGQRSEEVTVTAQRGAVKTDSAALGAVIDNRQIRGLPLNGRNFMEL